MEMICVHGKQTEICPSVAQRRRLVHHLKFTAAFSAHPITEKKIYFFTIILVCLDLFVRDFD